MRKMENKGQHKFLVMKNESFEEDQQKNNRFYSVYDGQQFEENEGSKIKPSESSFERHGCVESTPKVSQESKYVHLAREMLENCVTGSGESLIFEGEACSEDYEMIGSDYEGGQEAMAIVNGI